MNPLRVLQQVRSRRISATSLLPGVCGLRRVNGEYIASVNMGRLYEGTLASKGSLDYSLVYATRVKAPAHSFVDIVVRVPGSGKWALELCDRGQTGATSFDTRRHTVYAAGARGQAGCPGGVIQQLGQVGNPND